MENSDTVQHQEFPRVNVVSQRLIYREMGVNELLLTGQKPNVYKLRRAV